MTDVCIPVSIGDPTLNQLKPVTPVLVMAKALAEVPVAIAVCSIYMNMNYK